MVNICEDIDDIEDIVKIGDLKPNERYSNKKNVVVRTKINKNRENGGEIDKKVSN